MGTCCSFLQKDVTPRHIPPAPPLFISFSTKNFNVHSRQISVPVMWAHQWKVHCSETRPAHCSSPGSTYTWLKTCWTVLTTVLCCMIALMKMMHVCMMTLVWQETWLLYAKLRPLVQKSTLCEFLCCALTLDWREELLILLRYIIKMEPRRTMY